MSKVGFDIPTDPALQKELISKIKNVRNLMAIEQSAAENVKETVAAISKDFKIPVGDIKAAAKMDLTHSKSKAEKTHGDRIDLYEMVFEKTVSQPIDEDDEDDDAAS